MLHFVIHQNTTYRICLTVWTIFLIVIKSLEITKQQFIDPPNSLLWFYLLCHAAPNCCPKTIKTSMSHTVAQAVLLHYTQQAMFFLEFFFGKNDRNASPLVNLPSPISIPWRQLVQEQRVCLVEYVSLVCLTHLSGWGFCQSQSMAPNMAPKYQQSVINPCHSMVQTNMKVTEGPALLSPSSYNNLKYKY